MAYDPEILILDEATASVDAETEAALQHAVRAVQTGRTTLIVAHRLATVRDADRIVVMHKGRIVEEGPHDALLEKGGHYRRLWEMQFADE
jgi:ATP-binding cassette subfamily B protein